MTLKEQLRGLLEENRGTYISGEEIARRLYCAYECFENAQKAFEQYAEETAAMIVEPLLQGSAGMRMYPPLYLKKLRALCDSYDVLLIAAKTQYTIYLEDKCSLIASDRQCPTRYCQQPSNVI